MITALKIFKMSLKVFKMSLFIEFLKTLRDNNKTHSNDIMLEEE